ncbi:MAG: hypothetical protein R2796_03575 [Chitinophagaceae bacterium]|nr:hypothetical protein [Chitinophagaceae bacterium]HQV06502.1 hypothetical protein [Chitinophagaceae bacterium]
MKKIQFNLFFAFMVLITSCSCAGQKLVKTAGDAPKLEQHKNMFIGKPLSVLLNEIGPTIKMASAEGARSDGYPGFFYFRFVTRKEGNKLRLAKVRPISIFVYVKEKFVWDKRAKPVADREKWTEEDVNRYKNLTVVGISVSQ